MTIKLSSERAFKFFQDRYPNMSSQSVLELVGSASEMAEQLEPADVVLLATAYQHERDALQPRVGGSIT